MKFGVVNKWTILNRFVLHTLQRNITHLAVITRKTNIKRGILKGGHWKRALFSCIPCKIIIYTAKLVFLFLMGTTEDRKRVKLVCLDLSSDGDRVLKWSIAQKEAVI